MNDEIREHVRRLVAAAPPLTDDKRAKLTALLSGTLEPKVSR